MNNMGHTGMLRPPLFTLVGEQQVDYTSSNWQQQQHSAAENLPVPRPAGPQDEALPFVKTGGRPTAYYDSPITAAPPECHIRNTTHNWSSSISPSSEHEPEQRAYYYCNDSNRTTGNNNMSFNNSSSLASNHSPRGFPHLQHSYRPPQQQEQLLPSSSALDNYYSPFLVPVATGTSFDGYSCPDFIYCENQEIVQQPAQQHCHQGDSSNATATNITTNTTTPAAAAAVHKAALMCDLEMLREATTTTTPTAEKFSRGASSLPACAGGVELLEPNQSGMNYNYCELVAARDPIVTSNQHGAEVQETRQHCVALATPTTPIPRDTALLPPRPPKKVVHEPTKRPRPAGQPDQRRRVKQKSKVEALKEENVLLKQKVVEIAEKTSQLEKKVPPLSKRERSELEALRVMKQRVKSLFGC